jgi:hypothetical protein
MFEVPLKNHNRKIDAWGIINRLASPGGNLLWDLFLLALAFRAPGPLL